MYYRLALLLLLFCSTIRAKEFKFAFNGKMVAFHKFVDACPTTHNLVGIFRNVTAKGSAKSLTFDYVLEFKANMPKQLQLVIEIDKCASRENPDTCFRLTTFRTNRMCDFVVDDNQAWSPMLSCLSPTLICPFKKLNYTATGCTLDMAKFNWMPLGRSYFKFRVMMVDLKKTKRVLSCSLTEGGYEGSV